MREFRVYRRLAGRHNFIHRETVQADGWIGALDKIKHDPRHVVVSEAVSGELRLAAPFVRSDDSHGWRFV